MIKLVIKVVLTRVHERHDHKLKWTADLQQLVSDPRNRLNKVFD